MWRNTHIHIYICKRPILCGETHTSRWEKARMGLPEHVCKISRYFSRKRRRLPTITAFNDFSLNQLVPGTRYRL